LSTLQAPEKPGETYDIDGTNVTIARQLNIKGFVENQKDGTIQIILETQKETLDKFFKK
jgi:acylphosphatase